MKFEFLLKIKSIKINQLKLNVNDSNRDLSFRGTGQQN